VVSPPDKAAAVRAASFPGAFSPLAFWNCAKAGSPGLGTAFYAQTRMDKGSALIASGNVMPAAQFDELFA